MTVLIDPGEVRRLRPIRDSCGGMRGSGPPIIARFTTNERFAIQYVVTAAAAIAIREMYRTVRRNDHSSATS